MGIFPIPLTFLFLVCNNKYSNTDFKRIVSDRSFENRVSSVQKLEWDNPLNGQKPGKRYSEPSFEFLKEMINKEYFDVDFASKAEAGDEKDLFLEGQMAVIGFPTDEYGQMNFRFRSCDPWAESRYQSGTMGKYL